MVIRVDSTFSSTVVKKKLELINNEQPLCRPHEGIVKFKMSVAMIFVNKIINKSWQMG